jgi:hypothetical protein
LPRTIKELPEAREALFRLVTPHFYRSLMISPIEGWVTVRGHLAGTRVAGAKIVRSDLDGRFDSLALELAKNLQVQGNRYLGTQIASQPVVLHVLLYHVSDGTLAVSFANLDVPGGSQIKYYGSAWMAVEKNDGRWLTINPNWMAPHEQRGPRSYVVKVLAPPSEKPPRSGSGPALVAR